MKSLVKKIVRLLGMDVSKVGNALGSIRKNTVNFLLGGKSRIQYVNIGGGPFYKPGWGVLDYTGWSYDYFPGTVDWQHNLASFDPFPLRDTSIRAFYSSHCLEHIPYEFHRHILSEIHRCLKPGGIVRITTPDFDIGYDAAKRGDRSFFEGYCCKPGGDIYTAFVSYFCAAHILSEVTGDEIKAQLKALSKEDFLAWVTRDVPQDWFEANQGHVAAWTLGRFNAVGREAGFREFKRSRPHESACEQMRHSGFAWAFDHRFPEGSLYVEAVK